MAIENFFSKKTAVLAIIILLAVLIFISFLPYINAFFGALILGVLFKPLYNRVHNKWRLNKTLSALIVMLAILIIVLIPLSLIVVNVVNQAPAALSFLSSGLGPLGERVSFLHLGDSINKIAGDVAGALPGILLNIFSSIGNFFVTLFIMFFILYYLLTIEGAKLRESFLKYSPFSEGNTNKLLNEFRNVTHSTISVSVIIALIQGAIMTVAYFAFGVQGALLWGFLIFLASFIPVIGTALVWVPVTLFLLLSKSYVPALVLLGIALFASNIDNLIRPALQKKVGQIHPLISVIGVFIGLGLFGFLGIILGPLMLIYFVLITKIFLEDRKK